MKVFCRGRFTKNLIHSAFECSADVKLLCVTSDGSNKWLLQPLFIQKLPYLLGCLITVHDRHIAVHQYEVVLTRS